MFINSIPNYSTANTSFKGVKNPKIAENRLKVLLSQDIWSDTLVVKMPESEEERKALIEILTNRLKLDRFVKISNDRARLIGDVSYYNHLSKTNPSHPELADLREKLQQKGDLSQVFETMNKDLEAEKNNNIDAYNYLKDINKMSDEYIDSHKLTIGKMDKFWTQMIKHNINPDGKLSTKELLEMVSGSKPKESIAIAQKQPLTKKQLLASIEHEYEQCLRKKIDIYKDNLTNVDGAREARKIASNLYKDKLANFPGIEKQIEKIFDKVEMKFVFQTDRLANVDIHPLGEVWKGMNEAVCEGKKVKEEIAELQKKLKEKPGNRKLTIALNIKDKDLNQAKAYWAEGLEYSVKYEAENRQIFNDAGTLSEYDFLTGENPTIKKHKELYDMYKKDKDSLPEEVWDEIWGLNKQK